MGMTLDKFLEQLSEDIFESYDKQNEDLQNKSSDAVVDLLTLIDQQRSKAKGNLHDWKKRGREAASCWSW